MRLFPKHPDLKVTWEPWLVVIGIILLAIGIAFSFTVCKAGAETLTTDMKMYYPGNYYWDGQQIIPMEEPVAEEKKPEPKVQWASFTICVPLKVEEKLESKHEGTKVWNTDLVAFSTGSVNAIATIECKEPNYFVQLGIVEGGGIVWREYKHE